MAYPFPTRTLSSTLADHLDDHNTIAATLGEAGFTAASTREEHLAEHNSLHPTFGLPTRALGDSATFHLNDHGTIHANLIQAFSGIRGNWGQQLNTANVPGWPGAFTSSHSTFLSLQTAVNAAGTGRIFRVTNDMTFTSSLTPHTNDQFWFDPGVLITGTALNVPAFTDGSFTSTGTNRAGVKFMNGSFTGFRGTLDGRSSSGWEIAYCDFTDTNNPDNLWKAVNPGQNAVPKTFIHHCKFFDVFNPIWGYQIFGGMTIEDCEFTTIAAGPDSTNKWLVGSSNCTMSHCWLHDNSNEGTWVDYGNFNITIEWCEINNNGNAGIFWEANPATYGGQPSGSGPGNTCRYNYIHDNAHDAIKVHACAGMEIYGNYLYRNQTAAQTGLPDAEVAFYINNFQFAPDPGGQASDLRNNNVHNNYIEVTPTIGGHAAKRGAILRVDTGASLTSVTPWVTNTKLNNWSDNYYKFNRALTSTDLMGWVLAHQTFTNKTWAQWQALPQDATSGAEV
jgi:Right handed beta helix region